MIRRLRIVVACAVVAVLVTGSGAAAGGARTDLGVGTNLLWDVAHGPGGFAAVGNSGVITMSRDGRTWRPVTSGTRQTLRAVTVDGDTYVAVGTGGTVLSWTAASTEARVVVVRHATPLRTPLLGIARIGGTWIAVGAAGTIITSRDLGRWTVRASGVEDDLFAVRATERLAVAVGDQGSIVTSTDGTSWSTRRDADGTWLWSVAHGDGRWVATGASGTVLASEDTTTWRALDSGTPQTLRGVAHGVGGFVASGSDGTILTSADGTAWVPADDPDVGVELWRPAFGDDTWVAVGAGGTRLWSHDRTRWHGQATTGIAFYGAGAGPSAVLAAGVGGVVAAREGARWRVVARAPGARELRNVTWTGVAWIAVGDGGTILVGTAADGTDLRPVTSGVDAELWSVARDDAGVTVVVGAGGTVLVSTDSGATWRRASSSTSATLFGVSYGPAGFVAVGVDGAAVHSPDGTTWSPVVTGTRSTLRGVAQGPEGVVAVGEAGTTVRSPDGASWTTSSRTSLTLRAVTWTGSAWIAAGGGGVILRSTDGARWSPRRSKTREELFAVVAEPPTSSRPLVYAVGGIDTTSVSADDGRTWRAVPVGGA